jgi:membrane protein YqaA with SNARE-associated domain
LDLIDILLGAIEDPFSYLMLFLIYVILAAIILPIPVEIGLFNPNIHPVWLIFVLALGKGIGAFIVYFVSQGIRKKIKNFTIGKTWDITKKIISKSEKFVKKYGHYGLFIIMSIPLMIDSLTLYLFSLLNPTEEKTALTSSKFVIINIAAGATRGIIILSIFYLIGVKLI